jgi:hypothetical protein
MVRTTSFRLHTLGPIAYKHRSAEYIRRPGYVAMDNVASLLSSQAQDNFTEEFVLPPKQPTPNVILRDDIMPKQRTRVVL